MTKQQIKFSKYKLDIIREAHQAGSISKKNNKYYIEFDVKRDQEAKRLAKIARRKFFGKI